MPARLTRRSLPPAQPGAVGDAGHNRQAWRAGVADGDADERLEGPAAAGGRPGRADRPAGMGGDAGRSGAAAVPRRSARRDGRLDRRADEPELTSTAWRWPERRTSARWKRHGLGA